MVLRTSPPHFRIPSPFLCFQVLWLSAGDNVSEVGTMNFFVFKKAGGGKSGSKRQQLVTAPLRSVHSISCFLLFPPLCAIIFGRLFPWRDSPFSSFSFPFSFLFLTLPPSVFVCPPTSLMNSSLSDGTILPGVTRRAILALARQWNEFDIYERCFTIHDLIRWIERKQVSELA